MFNIGELFGTLGLEDQFSKSFDSFSTQAEKAEKQSFSLGNAITSGVGIAIGERLVAAAENGAAAIGHMLTNLLDMSDQMTNTSQAFGIGVEALQKFNVAGAAVGVSGEQIAVGLRKLQVGLSSGNAEVQNAVKFLGLSTQQLKDMRPEDQLQTILEHLDKIPNAMDKTAASTALLGKTGVLLAPLGGGLKEAMQRAEDLGIVMSKDTIKAADDLGDSVGLLGMTFDGLKNNFVSVIVESEPLHVFVEGLTNILGELSVWVKKNEDDLRSFVDAGVVFAAQALTESVKVVEAAAAGFKALADIWTITKTAAELLADSTTTMMRSIALGASGHLVDAAKAWMDYKDRAVQAVKDADKEMDEHQAKLDGFVAITGNVSNKFQMLADTVAASVGKHHEAAAAAGKHTDTLFKSASAAKEAAKAQKELGDAFSKAATEWQKEIEAATHDKLEFLGGNALDASADMGILADKVEKVGGVSALSAGQLDELIKQLSGSMAKGGDNAWGMELLAKALQQVALNSAKVGATLPVALKSLGHFGQSFGAQFSDELNSAFADLPSVILGAIQGGGNVFKAVGSSLGGKLFAKDSALWGATTDFIGQHFGTTVASAIGGALPGLGALLGPVLGKIGGLIGGLFGGGEGKKVNDMRDQFIAASGGLAVLNQKAHDAGLTLDALLSAKKVDDFQKAVSGLNLGFDEQAKTQEFLNSTIEKYGFSIEELGPTFAAQRLQEQAQSLVDEYEALTAAGVDHTAIINKMGPAFDEFVNAARKSGQSIPEAMRPMIDELLKAGQITDENGNAFKTAEEAGITFSETLEVSVGKVTTAVERLVEVLMRMNNIHLDPIDVPVNYHTSGPRQPDPEELLPLATGGIVTGPTPALVGEAGPEMVLPLNDPPAWATSMLAGGPESIVVQNIIAGQRFDDVVNRRVNGKYVRMK